MPENEQNVLVPEREARVHPAPAPAGDKVLAAPEAEDLAYEELLSIARHEEWIGEHAGYLLDGTRVLTHTWECERPGYRGWYWTSTVTRAPRSKKVTVDEVSLLPGEDALLSPKWIPWEVRLEAAEEEIKERRAAEEAEEKDDEQADASDEPRAKERASRSTRERSGGARSGRSRSASGQGHRRQRRRVRTVQPEAETTTSHSASARAVRKRVASRASRGPVVRGSRRRTYDA